MANKRWLVLVLLAGGIGSGLICSAGRLVVVAQQAPKAPTVQRLRSRPAQTPETRDASGQLTQMMGPVTRVKFSDPAEPDVSGSSFALPFHSASGKNTTSPAPEVSPMMQTEAAGLSTGVGFVGLDGSTNFDPPDPQIAVGPNHVLEMVNSSGRISDKTGALVQDKALRAFFGVPDGWGDSDPKVIYDAPSGRFFAAYIAFDFVSEARVYLAVSSSSDPTGSWCKSYYSWTSLLYPPLADQVGIGLTNDKFTFSVGIYNLTADTYIGEETVVEQKSDWLACADNIGYSYFPIEGPPWFTTRPAHSLSSVNDQFLAEFDGGAANNLCIDRVTGTPNAGNVARTTTCKIVTLQVIPPDASQLGGGDLIGTNDNRVLDAVWRANKLWVSANSYCDWGSGRIRSCYRVTEVDTSTMTITQDMVRGNADFYYYYPAIQLDGNGNLYVV